MSTNHEMMDTRNAPREMGNCLREDMGVVKKLMKEIQEEIAQDMYSWYKGPSVKAYRTHIKYLMDDANHELKKWIEDEIAYIENIAWTIFAKDEELKQEFQKQGFRSVAEMNGWEEPKPPGEEWLNQTDAERYDETGKGIYVGLGFTD